MSNIVETLIQLLIPSKGSASLIFEDEVIARPTPRPPVDPVLASSRRRHVLLYGVDGVQHKRLLGLLPRCCEGGFRALQIFPGFCGGIQNTKCEQKTFSGPGWATTLTGVWKWKHGIPKNDENLRFNPDYPSIFHRMRDDPVTSTAKTYSFTGWDVIHSNFSLNEPSSPCARALSSDDETVTDCVLKTIADANIDCRFIFVQVNDIDEAGHQRGFGNFYDSCILKTDSDLSKIINTIKTRRPLDKEEWMVLVTTDHGRGYFGFMHGFQSSTEREIFLGFWFSHEKEKEKLSQLPLIPQTAICPSVLSYLGIKINSKWTFDGSSIWLPNSLEVNPLQLAYVKDNTLYWNSAKSAENETLTIMYVSLKGAVLYKIQVPFNRGYHFLKQQFLDSEFEILISLSEDIFISTLYIPNDQRCLIM